jgi:hypothetical protein
MKRPFIALLTIALMALMASGVCAYTFNNDTLVESWRFTSAVNYTDELGGTGKWHDVIGPLSQFQTFGANLNKATDTLTIYTNWGGAGNNYAGAYTADLFLDLNFDGSWDAAVRLDNATINGPNVAGGDDLTNGGKGSIYYNPLYKTSQDLFKGTGNIYGGQYDKSAPKAVATLVTSDASSTDFATVTWTGANNGIYPEWAIAVDLTNVVGFDPDNFVFLWGTGTCANDTAQGYIKGGVVPIPGAFVLLGVGLVRLAAYGRRRKTAM